MVICFAILPRPCFIPVQRVRTHSEQNAGTRVVYGTARLSAMLPLRRVSSNVALRTARAVLVSRRTIVVGRDHGNFNSVLLMVPQAEEWSIERFGKFHRM